MKTGFTLAETLITIGIIGIVAAITLPILIEKHNNKVIETRLEKFYSSINQAVNMSKAENGDVNQWFEDIYNTEDDKQNEFFMTYVGKYLNIVNVEHGNFGSAGKTIYYLADGSSFMRMSYLHNGRDWAWSPGNIKKCYVENKYAWQKAMGTCAFAFMFTDNKGFRAFDHSWNGTYSSLINHQNYGCNNSKKTNSNWAAYCTLLIQYNGWKIPKDYPFKIKIY